MTRFQNYQKMIASKTRLKKNLKISYCIDPLMPLVKEYQLLVSNFQGNAEKFYS